MSTAGRIRKYILSALAALAVCAGAPPVRSFAQTGSDVEPANDSLFSVRVLESFSLSDLAFRRTHVFSGPSAKPVLYVFLSPECPLCQNYTLALNGLYEQYKGRIGFYGIFPGKAYSAKTIGSFAEKYKIAYPLLIDRSFRLSRYLQATTTPQVVLLDPSGQLIYKGAIDNWVTTLGKNRARATEYYLQDAIGAGLDHQPVLPKRTKAVGCLINDR